MKRTKDDFSDLTVSSDLEKAIPGESFRQSDPCRNPIRFDGNFY